MSDAVTAQGRRAALARMTSTCTVRRASGYETVDGIEQPVWLDVYSGPCRVAGARSGSSGTTTQTVGGVELQVATREVHFPWDEADLRDGDLCEVLTGRASGVVFRLLEVDPADDQTALRVPVESTQRPEEWAS